MQRHIETLAFPICLAFFVFHPAFQHGMFFDGVTYASISRNLSLGLGSWWKPHYTATLHAEFFENPPVLFWLQSGLFRLLGDSVFVEKLYSVSIAILILVIMKLLINVTQAELSSELRKRGYLLSIVFLLSTEPYRWGATYSLLDFTLCLFCLVTCLLQLRYLVFGELKSLVFAPIFLTLAIGVKGIVGLYPLALSGLFFVGFHQPVNRRRVLINFGWCSISILIFLILTFYFSPSSYMNFRHYMAQHLAPALSGQRANGQNSFLSVLGWITTAQGTALGVAALLWLTSLKVRSRSPAPWFLWILIGLSASLPMGLSHVFHQYYLIPCLPLFALAMASFLNQNLGEFCSRIPPVPRRWFMRTACLALVIASGWDIALHPVGRDMQEVEFSRSADVVRFRGQTLKTCAHLAENFVLVAYLMRYARISLDGTASDSQQWQITGKACDASQTALYRVRHL